MQREDKWMIVEAEEKVIALTLGKPPHYTTPATLPFCHSATLTLAVMLAPATLAPRQAGIFNVRDVNIVKKGVSVVNPTIIRI